MIQSRPTAAGCLTSTDKFYIAFLFDLLSNISLARGDSRQFINRGFQVDSTKPIGISSRRQGESGMTSCVDSHKMVRGLAASQMYHNWPFFLTFTLNQNQTPGVQFFYKWKRGEEWTDVFPTGMTQLKATMMK